MNITTLFITTKAWKQQRCASVGEWIDKLIHPDVPKRNEILNHEKSRNLNYKVKEVNLKRLTLNDFMYMTFWTRQNYGDSKEINGYQGLGWGDRYILGAPGIFRTVKLYDRYYNGGYMTFTVVKTQRMYTTKSDPNVNYGCWMIMWQCRFIDCNKCATLMQDFDSGEILHMWGQVVHRKSLSLDQ